MNLRTGGLSEKQELRALLSQTYSQAKSSQDFYQRIASNNIQLYKRNGKIMGVQLKRKYRFKTLGYSEELILQLDLSKDIQNDITQQRLQKLEEKRNRPRSRDRGFEL